MKRWFHVVLPHDSSPAFPLLIYLAAYAQAWWVPAMRGFFAGLSLWVAFLLYGVYRVRRFHPAFDVNYRQWLRTTPWRAPMALPLGPVHWVPQDAFVLGVMLLMAFPLLGAETLTLCRWFVVGYLIFLSMALYRGDAKAYAYVVAFNHGFFFLFWDNLLGFWLMAAVTYLIAWRGLVLSLHRFPWDRLDQSPLPGEFDQSNLGWPFAQLGPKPGPRRSWHLTNAVALGALVGWLVYTADWLLMKHGMSDGVKGIVPQAILGLGLLRLPPYMIGHPAPLSLPGRLLTGRFIIKGYDQIFAAPLLTCISPLLGFALMIRFGWDPDIVLTATLGIALAITFGIGPDLHTWRLTGNHRITPTPNDKVGK